MDVPSSSLSTSLGASSTDFGFTGVNPNVDDIELIKIGAATLSQIPSLWQASKYPVIGSTKNFDQEVIYAIKNLDAYGNLSDSKTGSTPLFVNGL